MPGDTITQEECAARRAELVREIQDQLDEDKDLLDSLFGWGPTVKDVIKDICCSDEENGCDCQELLQEYKYKCQVISGLEAYLATGDFSKTWVRPTTTTLATAGPLGIRPKNASCCYKKIVDHLESLFGPLGEGLMPTPTLMAAVYIDWIAIKAMWKGDYRELHKATAEVELGRARVLKKLIFDVYALCCCEG